MAWRLLAYCPETTDGRNANVVDVWYDDDKVPAEAKAELNVRLRYLVQQPGGVLWPSAYYKQLVGGNGVGEIRFKSLKVQYRPLGYFGPSQLCFTFLFFAKEKGGQLKPRGALDTAKQRMVDVKAVPGRAMIPKRWIDGI